MAAIAIVVVGTLVGTLYRGLAINDEPFGTAAYHAALGSGFVLVVILAVVIIARIVRPPTAADRTRLPSPKPAVSKPWTAVFAAVIFLAGMGLYWQVDQAETSTPEVLVTGGVMLIIAVAAGERLATLGRWRTLRVRRPFEWNWNWIVGITATASLIGFGLTGLVGGNSGNDLRGLAMLAIGLTIVTLVGAWSRLPKLDDARSSSVGSDHAPGAGVT